ncbi:hypothetical protein GN244_ATG12239 [Phytophthora infestans]|uniref:Uncharacterized protein n=1 Tax=Phytophthora infestans TaxID=4787 RepID=A0A833WI00_PHYIN|nr:hypothetical protein GN244_ATG12239 [Phytophthora infestans]
MFSWLKAQRMLSMVLQSGKQIIIDGETFVLQLAIGQVAVVGHDRELHFHVGQVRHDIVLYSAAEGYELGRRALVVHGHFLDGHFGHEVCLVGLHDLSGLALEHDLAQHGRHASGSCEYLDTLKPEICTVPDSKDLGRLNEPLTSMSEPYHTRAEHYVGRDALV